MPAVQANLAATFVALMVMLKERRQWMFACCITSKIWHGRIVLQTHLLDIRHRKFYGRAFAATLATAFFRVWHTVHKLLRRETVASPCFCLVACIKHCLRGHCPARATTSLIWHVARHGKIAPIHGGRGCFLNNLGGLCEEHGATTVARTVHMAPAFQLCKLL